MSMCCEDNTTSCCRSQEEAERRKWKNNKVTRKIHPSIHSTKRKQEKERERERERKMMKKTSTMTMVLMVLMVVVVLVGLVHATGTQEASALGACDADHPSCTTTPLATRRRVWNPPGRA